MKKVKIGNRNRHALCQRCGKEVGEVSDYAWAKWGGGGKTETIYCGPCGEIMGDTTNLSKARVKPSS